MEEDGRNWLVVLMGKNDQIKVAKATYDIVNKTHVFPRIGCGECVVIT